MELPEQVLDSESAASSVANRLHPAAPFSESVVAAAGELKHASLGNPVDSESVFATNRLHPVAPFSESLVAAAAAGELKHVSLGQAMDSESVYATNRLQPAAPFSESVATVAAAGDSKHVSLAQAMDSEWELAANSAANHRWLAAAFSELSVPFSPDQLHSESVAVASVDAVLA